MEFLSEKLSDEFGKSPYYQKIRPTRVAIVHDFPQFNQEEHALNSIFSRIRVRVFSACKLNRAEISDALSSEDYDVVGLLGEGRNSLFPKRRAPLEHPLHLYESKRRREKIKGPIVLSFVPRTQFSEATRYLIISDAVVLCDTRVEGSWPLEVSFVAYRFFESLLVPSMLNVDLADVKRIAKGIGLAFDISDDDHKRIIAKLPRDCFGARSAILHFSCAGDVRLKEIYSVAKTVALKKGIPANLENQISTHSDARKIIRKMNVKMGIRVLGNETEENRESESSNDGLTFDARQKRINLAGILFGI